MKGEPVYLFDKELTTERAAEAVDRSYRAYCQYDGMAAYAELLQRERGKYPNGLPWGLHDRLLTLISEASSAMHSAWSGSTSVHSLAARPIRRPRVTRKAVRR